MKSNVQRGERKRGREGEKGIRGQGGATGDEKKDNVRVAEQGE